LISRYLGYKPNEPHKKTVLQKMFNGFIVIFPLIFFLTAVYLIFVKVQKNPILEIENLLNQKEYEKVLGLIEDSLKEDSISSKHLLVYASAAEYGINESSGVEKRIKYSIKLEKEDSTGIFIEESYMKKMNLFYDSKNFFNLLCDYVNSFPQKSLDSQISSVLEKGFDTETLWLNIEENCVNQIFSKEDKFIKNKMRQIAADNLNLRSKPSLDSDIKGSLSEKSNVLIRKKGALTTYKDQKANWYFIISEEGLQGWVFGSYLKNNQVY